MFKEEKRHGTGTYHYREGHLYIGGWMDDLKHGDGEFHENSGRIYRVKYDRNQLLSEVDITNQVGARRPANNRNPTTRLTNQTSPGSNIYQQNGYGYPGGGYTKGSQPT